MFDHEEIDYSILESKMPKGELESWVLCFLARTAPSFEQAEKFFNKKGIKLKKEDYKKWCKKNHYK
jgi:hypothetical protein